MRKYRCILIKMTIRNTMNTRPLYRPRALVRCIEPRTASEASNQPIVRIHGGAKGYNPTYHFILSPSSAFVHSVLRTSLNYACGRPPISRRNIPWVVVTTALGLAQSSRPIPFEIKICRRALHSLVRFSNSTSSCILPVHRAVV